MKILEIACFNYESVLIAANNGADRIEFCKDYSLGGITPDHDLIEQIKGVINIPVFVMIRPRGGNFCYSEIEINKMKEEILFCKKNKIDGVVFGVLENNNSVDFNLTKELIELAKPMSVTFHRAFDLVQNPFHELEKLISAGVGRILTSGFSDDALSGSGMINRLVTESNGLLKIIVGGGVRSENLGIIAKNSGANEFHSSALLKNNIIADGDEIKKLKEILSR